MKLYNDFGVVCSASKHKCRKYRDKYKGFGKKRNARLARRTGTVTLEARMTAKVNPSQGKRRVASNRCGNACGRRAVLVSLLPLPGVIRAYDVVVTYKPSKLGSWVRVPLGA